MDLEKLDPSIWVKAIIYFPYIIIDNHRDFPYIIIYLGKGHNMIIYDYVAYINDYVVKAPNIPQ